MRDVGSRKRLHRCRRLLDARRPEAAPGAVALAVAAGGVTARPTVFTTLWAEESARSRGA